MGLCVWRGVRGRLRELWGVKEVAGVNGFMCVCPEGRVKGVVWVRRSCGVVF